MYFPSGEPKINISSTPSSNNLAIGATINLTCTAWQTDDMARNPRTKPYKIEWFDPQDRRVGDSCRAGFPVALLMRCTLMVGALTDENLGNYTCRARNFYNYCSTKRFEIKLRGKHEKMQNAKCLLFTLQGVIIDNVMLAITMYE